MLKTVYDATSSAYDVSYKLLAFRGGKNHWFALISKKKMIVRLIYFYVNCPLF